MKLGREMLALNKAVWKPPKLTVSFWCEKTNPESDSILNFTQNHTKLQLILFYDFGGNSNMIVAMGCETITETGTHLF